METHRVHEVVHTLRQKPLHVRENLALGIAAGITVLVAGVWAVTGAVNGTFSLAPESHLADAASEDARIIQEASQASSDGFSQLLGAAGAAIGATSTPASITIVNTEVHSTLDQDQVDPNATVINF